MDLITDTEVAALLEIAVNARLTDAVAATQAEFISRTGRSFERIERTVYPYSFGGDALFLPEAPIHEVLEVRFGDTVIADSPARIAEMFRWITTDGTPNAFRLNFLKGRFPSDSHAVMVRFVAGYWSVTDSNPDHASGKPPSDMRRALKNAAAIEYQNGGQERFQSYSVSGVESYTRPAGSDGDPLAALVRRYARPA